MGRRISLSFHFFMFLITLAKEQEFTGIGYCLWFYSILIIGDVNGKISTEMRSGTFEQIYLSAIPMPLLLLAKLISTIFRSFVIMAILAIPLLKLGYIDLSNTPILELSYIMLLMTPGLFGLSLLLGGLTIVLKDVGWLLNILNNSLLFLSGIFLPIEDLPTSLKYISEMNLITFSIGLIKKNMIKIFHI